jgi:hypothetical protein
VARPHARTGARGRSAAGQKAVKSPRRLTMPPGELTGKGRG